MTNETTSHMVLAIKLPGGFYAGRYSMGDPLGPVVKPYVYLFTADERGKAEVLAQSLGGEVVAAPR